MTDRIDVLIMAAFSVGLISGVMLEAGLGWWSTLFGLAAMGVVVVIRCKVVPDYRKGGMR